MVALSGARAEDFPELESAFHAWRRRDWSLMVSTCLASLGVRGEAETIQGRLGWTFAKDSAVVYLSVDRRLGVIDLEAPILMLPATQRAPLFRTLLEMNARATGIARFSLRRDRICVRFSDRLENLNPPKLVHAIVEVASIADAMDDPLSAAYQARMIGPRAKADGMDWKHRGKPVLMPSLVPEQVELAPLAASAPTDAVDAAVQGRAGFVALLRDARGLEPLIPGGDRAALVGPLFLRALLYRACHEHPKEPAIPLLLGVSDALSGDLFVEKKGWRGPDPVRQVIRPAAEALSLVVDMLVNAGGEPPQGGHRGQLTQLPHRAAIKKHIDGSLPLAAEAPAQVRHFILMGLLAELLVRARLPAAHSQWVTEAYTRGKSQAIPGPLAAALRRVVA